MQVKDKNYDSIQAGARIKKQRQAMGYTAEQISEKLNISDRFYRSIERGSTGMSVETLILIGKELDMSLDYIIYGDTLTKEEYLNDPQVLATVNLMKTLSPPQRENSFKILNLFQKALQGNNLEKR